MPPSLAFTHTAQLSACPRPLRSYEYIEEPPLEDIQIHMRQTLPIQHALFLHVGELNVKARKAQTWVYNTQRQCLISRNSLPKARPEALKKVLLRIKGRIGIVVRMPNPTRPRKSPLKVSELQTSEVKDSAAALPAARLRESGTVQTSEPACCDFFQRQSLT